MSSPSWLVSLVQGMTDPTSSMHVMTDVATRAQFDQIRALSPFLVFYRAELKPVESSNAARLQAVVELPHPVDARTLRRYVASACWRDLEELLVRGRRGHKQKVFSLLDGVIALGASTARRAPDECRADAFAYRKELIILSAANQIDVAIAPDMTLEAQGNKARLTFGVSLRLRDPSKVFCVRVSRRAGSVGVLS